jgi:hypothetical protein
MAFVPCPRDADARAIIAALPAATDHWMDDAGLHVVGVSQEDLDAAATPARLAPVVPPRIISGAEFLALWTPAEIAAAWAADPRLMAGAMKVLAQNGANLDSPECAALLALAEAQGVLTPSRRARVAAGLRP